MGKIAKGISVNELRIVSFSKGKTNEIFCFKWIVSLIRAISFTLRLYLNFNSHTHTPNVSQLVSHGLHDAGAANVYILYLE